MCPPIRAIPARASRRVNRVSVRPHGVRHFKIALAATTVELPWTSRAPLLKRVERHPGGLQVRLAFEAVGATRPVKLEPAGKRLLLQVVEEGFGEATADGLPTGVSELRNELQAELSADPLGETKTRRRGRS